MTRAIITGVAGFIGSHLSEELLKRGYTVIGIDNFDPWYDPDTKSSNLEPSLSNSSFDLLKEDIRTFDFSSCLMSICFRFWCVLGVYVCGIGLYKCGLETVYDRYRAV